MNFQVCAIFFVVSFCTFTCANYIVDGVGGDIISGYLLSPVFGPSKIFLTRKFHHKALLHPPPVPPPHGGAVPFVPGLPVPFVPGSTVPFAYGLPPPYGPDPISENYFKIEEDEDILKK